MKPFRFQKQLTVALLSLSLLAPLAATAEQESPFSGEITEISQQRFAVTLSSGETLWFTTLTPLAGVQPGQRISGIYEPVADTLLARDLVIEPASD